MVFQPMANDESTTRFVHVAPPSVERHSRTMLRPCEGWKSSEATNTSPTERSSELNSPV